MHKSFPFQCLFSASLPTFRKGVHCTKALHPLTRAVHCSVRFSTLIVFSSIFFMDFVFQACVCVSTVRIKYQRIHLCICALRHSAFSVLCWPLFESIPCLRNTLSFPISPRKAFAIHTSLCIPRGHFARCAQSLYKTMPNVHSSAKYRND